MHTYFRNHQTYIAEKALWLDRHIAKTSKRALIKIESLKLIAQTGEFDDQLKLIEKLVNDTLLSPITSKSLLFKEGHFLSNLNN